MDHLEKFRVYRKIICIDLKSFFACAECASLGFDPFTTNLVVADISRGTGGIVLATSPSLKKHGFSGRFRLYELPPNLKVEIIKPRMSYYVELSNKILNLYLQYFSRDDILVYSIDEVFIDVTSYLNMYKTTPYKIARALLKRLEEDLNMFACCGIGNNMLLAKYALDIEAKHNPDNIAIWSYDNIAQKLWPIKDLTSVWGIGRGTVKTLNSLGIYSMYDLAHYDIYKLVKRLGIYGEEIYLHAYGIDISRIQDQKKLNIRKGYSIGHTLHQDSTKDVVRHYFKDLVLSICTRLREDNKIPQVIRIYVRYSRKENLPSFGIQRKLSNPSFDTKVITDIVLDLFDRNVQPALIRQIGIGVMNILDFQGVQLNLFESGNDVNNQELDHAYDILNLKYGEDTLIKASTLTDESSFLKRKKLIGGHNAK